MAKKKLAIIGASGLVGQALISVLKEENMLDKFDLTLYVSDRSAGSLIIINNVHYRLIKLDKSATKIKYDLVFFSAGDDVSLEYAEAFAESSAFVIDNSNAFRRRTDVPLVVPEINAHLISKNTKIIANPNCSTIQLVVVLERLKKLAKINKVVVSTYQSVSGAGTLALKDLKCGTNKQIKEGITNNVVAYIGAVNMGEFCTEEDKMMFETNKILNEDISLCATTVRVPVPYCHSESVYIKFDKKVELDDVLAVLDAPYIKASAKEIFLPTKCAGKNLTYVCRIRKFSDSELAMFIVSDNLRRGASFNAAMIAKIILDKFL